MPGEINKALTNEQKAEVKIRRNQINALKKVLPELKKTGIITPKQEERVRDMDRLLKEFE